MGGKMRSIRVRGSCPGGMFGNRIREGVMWATASSRTALCGGCSATASSRTALAAEGEHARTPPKSVGCVVGTGGLAAQRQSSSGIIFRVRSLAVEFSAQTNFQLKTSPSDRICSAGSEQGLRRLSYRSRNFEQEPNSDGGAVREDAAMWGMFGYGFLIPVPHFENSMCVLMAGESGFCRVQRQ